MNLFLYELRANLRSLIFWCLGFFFIVAIGMGKFTGLDNSGDAMKIMLDQVPVIKAMLGGDFDYTVAIGFFGVLYLYLLLMSAIHAALFGSGIVSKEERDRTSEFLYVKPKTRTSILVAKTAVALINVVIVNLATTAAAIPFVNFYSHGKDVSAQVVSLMLGMFLVQTVFLAIGFFCAVLTKRPKLAPALATGVLLAAFFLSMAMDLNPALKVFRFLTPFKFFPGDLILAGTGFQTGYLILTAVLVVGFFVASFLRFKKRDFSI